MSRSDTRQCWTLGNPPFGCRLDQEACTTDRSERTSLESKKKDILDIDEHEGNIHTSKMNLHLSALTPGTPAPGENVVLKNIINKNGIAPKICTAWSGKFVYKPSVTIDTNSDKLSKRTPKKNPQVVRVPRTASMHPNCTQLITNRRKRVKVVLRYLFIALLECNKASASSII